MANDRTAPGGMGMLLLALLEGRDMYGYEMIEALRARSNEVFHLKAGTLYPLLHSLEAQGWVTSPSLEVTQPWASREWSRG